MWGMWDTRNYAKHHTMTEVCKEAILELNDQIILQHQQGIHDLLPDDHILFDLPVEDLLECAWDYKRRWVDSVQAGRSRYQQQQQQTTTQSNLNPSRELFRNWLQV